MNLPLRVTSPCEHNVEHHILSLQENSTFSVRECVDSRKRPRVHVVTSDKYPEVVDRRSLR